MSDAIEAWLEHRRKIAQRPIRLPAEKAMIKAVKHLSNPRSTMSKAFLPGLTRLAGRTLIAQEIVDGVGAAYNAAIKVLPPMQGSILMALLEEYPRSFVPDPEVARMTAEHIVFAFEQAARRRNSR